LKDSCNGRQGSYKSSYGETRIRTSLIGSLPHIMAPISYSLILHALAD